MRILRAAAPLLSLGIALAACSGGGATPSPAATPASSPAPTASAVESTAPSEAPSASPASSPASGAVMVQLAETTLGNVLADGTGKTLYVFTADSGGTPTCSGGCADNWPPLTSDAVPTLGQGLDAEDFALIDRGDGTKQVTFYGQPLYYFAGDSKSGDTNGQGVGGKWFVVDADGKLIK